jgi:hypothetical protein
MAPNDNKHNALLKPKNRVRNPDGKYNVFIGGSEPNYVTGALGTDDMNKDERKNQNTKGYLSSLPKGHSKCRAAIERE